MSQISNRKNWVVISGLVREPEVFYTKLQTLIHWRSQGLIDGIVYSTWIGQLNKYQSLNKLIEDSGILVVETKEPKLRLVGHILHQMKAIHYGIEACPEDAYILKMRPDLGNLVKDMRHILSGKLDLTVNEIDGWPKIFQQRIVVIGGKMLDPFHLNDFMFYGTKSDVKKLIHFDLRYEILFSNLAAEQWFYANPFIDVFQIFTSYFQFYRQPVFRNKETGIRYVDYLLSSPLLLKIFMTYILILSCYFRIKTDMAFPEKITKEREIIQSIPYGSIFSLNSQVPGISFDYAKNTFGFHGETWIHALIQGGFKNDDVGNRLHQALEEVKKWSFHKNWVSNSLRFDSEVAQVHQELKEFFSSKHTKKVKIAKLSKLKNTTKFTINSEEDRFEVVNNEELAFQELEKERLSSRRLVRNLRQELQHKSQEIQQLKQELAKYQINQKTTIETD